MIGGGRPALALAAGLCFAPLAGAVALEDTAANRRAQAQRYEAAMPVSVSLENSLQRVAHMMPPEHRPGFIAFARARLDETQLRDTVMVVLTETFTADELQAMADFFGSSVGQSVAGKMGRFKDRVVPLMMMTVQDAAIAYAEQQGATE
ncbi:DUF2059 domain-containing protein [Roseospira marina]|uniref:DUF2059 domain-containing protein n=1 Tax=Roseospira marina TaxID=140057 RepID=A0A5M6IH77_9PROT|nr:DUF2059 domain-containing protein [Roseospira marina]KAA5607643.1 DUF2059 domain-containing protein [Roseospira marina]MBB4312156.1 hypothetical protein [Roseospira marina]MBB5085828.1 hypothetical protein [Roseospira marina]